MNIGSGRSDMWSSQTLAVEGQTGDKVKKLAAEGQTGGQVKHWQRKVRQVEKLNIGSGMSDRWSSGKLDVKDQTCEQQRKVGHVVKFNIGSERSDRWSNQTSASFLTDPV